MLNRNMFDARLVFGARQRSARVSRPRRNGRPKVSSFVRLKQPAFGASLLTPPNLPTEGLVFYSAKSITPGDSQVRM